MPSQPLRLGSFAEDPFEQFNAWFRAWRETDPAEIDAAALATSTPDGRPSLRMVLVRSVDARGFVFYTNYESRKGSELDGNPHAALLYFWQVMGRQVRIEGPVERVPVGESDRYFDARPAGSRISAIASPQSREIENRAWLETRHRELAARHASSPPARPRYWGGYRLRPSGFEFWQHGADRLHDRIAYAIEADGSWRRSRLAP